MAIGIETNEEQYETTLLDLPCSILSSVLARLRDPVDLVSAVSVCRLLKVMASTTPLQLKLSPGLPEDGIVSSNEDLKTLYNRQRAALAAIRTRMTQTRALDLTGCSILDDDVASLLGCLKHMDSLILDGCQKLTSSVVDALAVSVRSGPRVLSIQRCFRIGPTAAGNLLAAAAADGSKLQCILFSHLDRLDLPRESPLIEGRQEAINSIKALKFEGRFFGGLRILALHNCGGLGAFELDAVAETCPSMELLFLGGSVEGLGLSTSEGLTSERIESVTTAILSLIHALKSLRIIELTFFTQPVVQAVRENVEGVVEIWDLCEEESVTAAAEFLQELRNRQKRYDILSLSHWEEEAEDIAMALRAAANCSDVRRRTPLHVAASEGNAITAANLVNLGSATTGMKDSAGAIALFVAAERGHANVCRVLLEGGADAFAKNRAGENPIYISALRGNCSAMNVIISYCRMRGLDWQNVNLYCDGWTPLMAAAVADRQDVGREIFRAIGYNSDLGECSSSQIQSQRQRSSKSKLIDAQNRYGQTALHIASRRSSIWFVKNLVAAGACVDVLDEYGNRAIDVASQNGQLAAVCLLKQWRNKSHHLKKNQTKLFHHHPQHVL